MGVVTLSLCAISRTRSYLRPTAPGGGGPDAPLGTILPTPQSSAPSYVRKGAPAVNTTICQAIGTRAVIEFSYGGGRRLEDHWTCRDYQNLSDEPTRLRP